MIRHSAVVFAGSMSANIAAWLYHIIIGRILGTEAYGELAALLSLFYILNVPSSVIQTVLVKFFSILKATDGQGQAKRLIRFVSTILFLVDGIGLIFILLFSRAIASFLHIESWWYVIWLYLIFATYMVTIVNASALQGYQLFFASTVVSTTGMMLRLIFGVGLAFFGVGWVLVSNIFSNIVSYGLSFIPLTFLAGKIEKPVTIKRKDVLKFSVPALITTLCVTLLFSQDVLLVKHYLTSYEAGIYASLSILGKVLFYATSAVSYVLFPVVSERSASGRPSSRLVVWGLFIIGAVCMVLTIVYFFIPDLVLLAFGKAFTDATKHMGMFAVFISFFSLSSILMNTLLAIDKVNVWIFTALFALLQTILIAIFHTSISQIIIINIIVSGGLFFTLVLYYVYSITEKSG